ncbi:tyrosine-type recombinase/integrase [Streptomyces sp. NPDC060028]|uniref:tyrosine-type recombinase/integrase n=1 Tax=Streptomyces sp. NPDC060028 TaxID=3347041 RepID=UPI0036B4155E
MIATYRAEEWAPAAEGRTEQSAAMQISYLVRVLDAIDETTRIDRRDAAMLALVYGKLSRRIEAADLLVEHVRISDSEVWVYTVKSKTDQKVKGSWRRISYRADLQLVTRLRSWLRDLHELGADQPRSPLFRALTVKGNLANRTLATDRGNHLSGRAVNEMAKKRAAAAGLPYIAGLKVTAHSWRAGSNTDMSKAGVPLKLRNRAGGWAKDSRRADTTYDRPDNTDTIDPMDAVPLYGNFTPPA